MNRFEVLQPPAINNKHKMFEFLIPSESGRKMRKQEQQYWVDQGYNLDSIPKRIIIATASARKMLMMNALLHATVKDGELCISFPEQVCSEYASAYSLTQPRKIQKTLTKHIFNSDGAYTGRAVLLGHYQGVPVFGASTSGETKDATSPELQAYLKANHYFQKKKLARNNLIIVSSDSLDFMGDRLPQKPLGKPIHDEDYPKKELFHTEAAYECAVQSYMKHYVTNKFSPFSQMFPTAGMAAINARTGRVQTQTVYFPIPVRSNKFDTVTPDQYSAGGAVSQQFIDLRSDFYRNLPKGWRLIIYCMIMGAPLHPMMHLAVEVGKPSQQRPSV